MHPLLLAVCCSVGGNVHSVSGMPLAHATVIVRGATVTSATTDARGDFSVVVPPGKYRVEAASRGFASVAVAIAADGDERLQVALEPLDSPRLREIGAVSVDGRLLPIEGTVPATTISRADFDALGEDRIVDGLAQVTGATFARPDGGASSAVTAVALRGPDPSESLIALDGQLLNDGNTGDLDLSRLPVAAFSSLDVTEGLGPEDSNGSNTFGGAIDLVSLRPTATPHVGASFSDGTFGRSEAWVNATGRLGRLGYATAFDDQNELGYVDRTVPFYSASDPACAPCATHLGSALASHLGLGTLTYSFSQRADVTARVFALGDRRDQSAAVNGIDERAADAGTPTFGAPIGPGAQTFSQNIRAYQLRGRTSLGAGELTADLSESDNAVDLAGGSVTPYDLTHRDRRENAALGWQRAFATSQFAVGGYLRYESLDFFAPPSNTLVAATAFQAEPLLAQRIATFYARGGFRPTARIRLDGALFESRYSTFGSNLDGRFGAIYDLGRATTARVSFGTGFRAPLLAERYRYPYSQLTLDGNNVFIGQGSANELPEHATEYELGASHEFSTRATLDVSLYRTNLRNPVEVFYPLSAVASGACATNSYAAPLAACVSSQGNVGNAVYQGAELRLTDALVPRHVYATASYGLNVSYPKNLSAPYANPTSGGNLVDNAQFFRVPQQQGSLVVDYRSAAWHAATSAVLRGKNNELAQPAFGTLAAAVGRALGGGLDLSLRATNLTNAVAGPFTRFGAGVPYRGITGRSASGASVYGNVPTDATFIEPRGVRVILTLKD